MHVMIDPWIRDPGWVKSKDPDPGWKKLGSGIRDGKNSDPGSGMGKPRIRDPGWRKFGSGINIPDPQHCREGTCT
jgi:hypothetical protein